ncbi:RNaseH domain-containing protein [Roseomonas sp. E05]|uniref:RNaseH domain-containing protein n=1 Tax=Roseomonas sp. E05 TaxID=3046310 RepID=UPI0024BA497B|nr:RNaseH domain-containing protein [Roseomonas sp. E05]MDJ0388289.1 RNaseH domain-containing protein [Roseomonas sp. E05]
MSEPEEHVYRALPGYESDDVAIAFLIAPDRPVPVQGANLEWSERLAGLLSEIGRQAADTKQPTGRQLPYASLRALLQVAIPEAVLLTGDLSAPWSRKERRPFLQVAGDGAATARRAAAAFRQWAEMILTPWAERLDLLPSLVESAIDAAGGADAFEVEAFSGDLAADLRRGAPFDRYRQGILQELSRRIEGREIFPGLGPVMRVVRSQSNSNDVEFLSWPQVSPKGGRFSMSAQFSLGTVPYLDKPVLRIRASRKRWLEALPRQGALWGRDRVHGHMARRDGPPIVVEFAAHVGKDGIEEVFSPAFLTQAMRMRAPLGGGLAALVDQRAEDVFTAFAYAPNRDGRHCLGGGATTRDQLDLMDAALPLLAPIGARPLPFSAADRGPRTVKRAVDQHGYLATAGLIDSFARSLGHEDADPEDLLAVGKRLLEGGEPPEISPDAAWKARETLEKVREWNRDRLRRAFGNLRLTIVAVADQEQERLLIRHAIAALFGDALDVQLRQLPADTHGPRDALPASARPPRERFNARIAAWTPLADALGRDLGGTHVLVCAAAEYGGRRDDTVNLMAGRHALATKAEANVQYLLPCGGWADFDTYLHRVQSAVYDLLFGHSGLVSEVAPLLQQDFPDPVTRPQRIIGISVITKARSQRGGKGSRLCLATRIGLRDGRTEARVGWFNGTALQWSGWQAFSEALKTVARLETASLGPTEEMAKRSFQAFVRAVIDEAVEDGERPVVMVDSTTAAGLWPWLRDTDIGREPTIGADGELKGRAWSQVRLVRVRETFGSRVVERKVKRYERLDPESGRTLGVENRYQPTVTANTVRLSSGPGGSAHYWVTDGYRTQPKRGLSVYREVETFGPLSSGGSARDNARGLFKRTPRGMHEDTYQVPNALEVTVAKLAEGDEADRVAHLVASLRHGYGHTASATTLPAPLSFESKVRDYMARFHVDDADKDVEPTEEELEAQSTLPLFAAAVPAATTPPEPDPDPDPGGPLPRGVRTGDKGNGDRGSKAMSKAKDRVWNGGHQGTLLELPDGVDREWVRTQMAIVASDLRHLNEWRQEIRDLSGFAWPAEKVSSKTLPDVLLAALRYPSFLRVATRILARSKDSKAKRWKATLFTHVKGVYPASVPDGPDPKAPPQFRDRYRMPHYARVAEQIQQRGTADELEAFVIYSALTFATPADVRPLDEKAVSAEEERRMSSLRRFVASATELLDDGFEFVRDIVEQQDAPRQPPAPRDDEVAPWSAYATAAAPAEAPPTVPGGPAADIPTAGSEPTRSEPPAEAADAAADASLPGDQASEPPLPAAAPDAHSPAAASPADAALAMWRDALGRAAAAANAALGGNPDADLLGLIEKATSDAAAAARDWEAARPKLVDAAATVAALRDLLASVAALPNAPKGAVPETVGDIPWQVEEGVKAAADEAAEQGRAILAEASARVASTHQRLRALDPDTTSDETMEEATRDHTAARVARSAAMHRIVELCGAASEMLRDAAPPPASAPPAVPPIDAPLPVSPAPSPEALGRPLHKRPEGSEAPQAEAEVEAGAAGPEAAGMPDDMEADDELEELPPLPAGMPLPLAAAAAPSPPPAPEPMDPLAASVAERVERYFAAGDFSLAYHLTRAARRVFQAAPFPFSLQELRLAAVRGHVSHASTQGSPQLASLVDEATKEVAEAGSGTDLGMARRVALSASLLELAMFHQGLNTGDGLRLIQDVSPEMRDGFHELIEALALAGRTGFVLPQHFHAVQAEAVSTRFVDDCAERIRKSIAAFEGVRFSYVPANIIRNELLKREQIVGRLQAALSGELAEALPAAREFAEACADEDAVGEIIDAADNLANTASGVNGHARNRLVSTVADIAAACKEYVAAAEALPLARDSARNANLKATARRVASGAEAARRALAEHAEAAGPLTLAAIRHAEASVDALVQSVQGRHRAPGPQDNQTALHGALYWLRGLTFGQSWLPAPYDPEEIIGLLLAHDGAPRQGVEAWRRAVARALSEGSLIAAKLLIDAAAFYAIPSDAAKAADDDYRHTRANARQSLIGSGEDVGEIERVRRLIEKVQRMGRFSRIDQAQAELARLDRINTQRMPETVSLEERTEDEEADQILDIRAARALLADVEQRIAQMLAEPKREMAADLQSLKEGGASSADLERIQRILDADDLLTAGELISFLKSGSALPESTSPNPRYKAYFPEIPAALGRIGKRALEDACRAIQEGRDLDVLPFGRVLPDRKDDAVEIARSWRDLRALVEHGREKLESVAAAIATFLGKAGFSPDLRGVLPPAKSGASRKAYCADFRIEVPTDNESLLLPDFGSATGGLYRFCAVLQVPTESEMKAFRDAAPDNYGLIVLVMQSVDAERRMQLAGAAIQNKRRALVIDESILLYALSEPSFRPLTLLELAQPSSFATPYTSPGSGAVPPEMFFGRRDEINEIWEQNGSCIVYGGRRLGKTALLHRVRQIYHREDGSGAVVAYADIRSVGGTDAAKHLWEHASRAMPEVFPKPVQKASQFTDRVRQWLDEDDRRRVLLLLDEADLFIQSDARAEYEVFLQIRGLMDDMKRRFKFVLSGLKNVSRLSRTENPPLKHIAAKPIRVGPLMDEELARAEDMVVRPLAAMGYEFESRGDVWRILSHCNYYPILVQSFCAGLHTIISKGASASRKPERRITSRLVLEALENPAIVKEIKAKFDHTLHEIDERYGLIAFVVAHRSLEDQEVGRADEGMTATQLYDHARAWWEPAFESLESFKDLLDEMEGMGVLRQTAAGTWTLRSHTLLRLLENREELERRLLEFDDREPPSAFDPRSMRRPLKESTRFREVRAGHHSPLTLGQEHGLFHGKETVGVVFGNALSDVGLVGAALASADHVRSSDGSAIGVTPRIFTECDDLLDAVRLAGRSSDNSLLVVDIKSRWDSGWVNKVTANRIVRAGQVRVVFVGGPEHAFAWLSDPHTQRLPPQVSVLGLAPWSDAMTASHLLEDGLSPQALARELTEALGGFNSPMTRAFHARWNGNQERFMRQVAKWSADLRTGAALPQDLGLLPQVADCFGAIERLEAIDDTGAFTLKEAGAALSLDGSVCALPLAQLMEYGTLMGFLRMEPLPRGTKPEDRTYRIAPLARPVIASARAMEAA